MAMKHAAANSTYDKAAPRTILPCVFSSAAK